MLRPTEQKAVQRCNANLQNVAASVLIRLVRMGDKLGSLTKLVDGVLYSVEVFAKALNIDPRYREGSTLVTRAHEYWSCKEDVSEFLSPKQKTVFACEDSLALNFWGVSYSGEKYPVD